MPKKFDNVIIRNTRIAFRDFKGDQDTYGVPSFNIIIPDDAAKELSEIGWPIKYYQPKNKDEEPFYHIKIKIRYHTRTGDTFCEPEEIMVIVNGKRTYFKEDTVRLLNSLTFEKLDVEFEWYPWTFSGKTGDGAQLERLYAIAKSGNELQAEWAEEEFPDDDEMPF